MFEKQTPVIETGIEVYKNHSYVWENGLLMGSVRVVEDGQNEYEVFAEPHVTRLQAMDAHPAPTADCRYAFSLARTKGLFLGTYSSLDLIKDYLGTLDKFFTQTLADRGAVKRVLRSGSDGPQLMPTNQETEQSFVDALKAARDYEVFVALRQGQALPLHQIVGRVFRSLAHTLGVTYFVAEDRDQQAKECKSVTFTYEHIGAFRFDDKGPGTPVQLTRFSYNALSKLYFPSFEGPADQHNMQRHVFNWLLDAMREVNPRDIKADFDFAAFAENRDRAIERFYGDAKIDKTIRTTAGNKNFLRLVH